MGRRKGDDENIVAERVNMVYALQLMGKSSIRRKRRRQKAGLP